MMFTGDGEGYLQIVLDLSQEPYFGMLCRLTRRWQNKFRKSPNAMPVRTISSAMLATLTAEFVAFYVSSNKIRANDIPSLMENVYRALQKIAGDSEEKVEPSTRTQSSATSGGRRARADLLSDTPVCATNGTVWPSTIARHNRLRRKLGRRRRR